MGGACVPLCSLSLGLATWLALTKEDNSRQHTSRALKYVALVSGLPPCTLAFYAEKKNVSGSYRSKEDETCGTDLGPSSTWNHVQLSSTWIRPPPAYPPDFWARTKCICDMPVRFLWWSVLQQKLTDKLPFYRQQKWGSEINLSKLSQLIKRWRWIWSHASLAQGPTLLSPYAILLLHYTGILYYKILSHLLIRQWVIWHILKFIIVNVV